MKKWIGLLVLMTTFVGHAQSELDTYFSEAKFPYVAPTTIPVSENEVDLFHAKTLKKLDQELVKGFLDKEFDGNKSAMYGLHHIKISESISAWVVLNLGHKADNGTYQSAYYQMIITSNNDPKLIIDISWNNVQEANEAYGDPETRTKFVGKYDLKGDLILEYPRVFDYLSNESWEGDYREYSIKTFEQVINEDEEGY